MLRFDIDLPTFGEQVGDFCGKYSFHYQKNNARYLIVSPNYKKHFPVM